MSGLIAALTLPLAGALIALVLPVRAAATAAIGAVIATSAAVLALIISIARDATPEIALGGWAPPIGIALRADGLSAVFMGMTAAVMLAVAVIARRSVAVDRAGPRAAFGFWPLMLLLWAAVNAVFVSRDLFNLYVGIELLTLSAVGLVALGGGAAALQAAMRYMLFALAGSLLYLTGVAIVYAAHGWLDIGLLAARNPAATDALALALMTAGLIAKAALFPFHVWLPPAHAGALAPASALLSAVVPKAAVLILWRIWFEALADTATASSLIVLGGLGGAAVVWGGICALAQQRVKRVVAYSTVVQIGYLFAVMPLVPLAAGAYGGAVLMAASHGLAKAAMFLAVGHWMQTAGSDRLADLRGLARTMPVSVFAFAIAAMTLAGLPPSGGFVAKWLVMTAAFDGGQALWAAFFLGGGVLALGYFYKPLAAVFAPAQDPCRIAPSWLLQAVPLALALMSILLGLSAAFPLALAVAPR